MAAAQPFDASPGLTHLHMDQLVETNRALQAAVLELRDLLRNSPQLTCFHNQMHSLPSTILPNVPVESVSGLTESQPVKKVVATVSAAEVLVDPPVYRIFLRRSFVEENESARQRYVERRNAEMLRLKHWIDYKCKSRNFLNTSPECSKAQISHSLRPRISGSSTHMIGLGNTVE